MDKRTILIVGSGIFMLFLVYIFYTEQEIKHKTLAKAWWRITDTCTAKSNSVAYMIAGSQKRNIGPAKDIFQGIQKFLVHIDFQGDLEKEKKALNIIANDGIDACKSQFEDNAKFCHNVKNKNQSPFYPQKELKNTISQAIELAYKECITDFHVVFTETKPAVTHEDEKTLIVLIQIPKVGEDEKYKEHFFITLLRKGFIEKKKYKDNFETKTVYYKDFYNSGNAPLSYPKQLSYFLKHSGWEKKD